MKKIYLLFIIFCVASIMVYGQGDVLSEDERSRLCQEAVREEITNRGTVNNKIFDVFYFLVRYVAPIVVVIIFISNFVL